MAERKPVRDGGACAREDMVTMSNSIDANIMNRKEYKRCFVSSMRLTFIWTAHW